MALAALAVLIPCGAWYVLGTRQLARETAQLLENARRDATSTAERVASHLTIRLEELDDHESNRPFVHYWPTFLAWGHGCKPSNTQRSPLSRGKRHKLVAAYFQINERGFVSSPEPTTDVAALAHATLGGTALGPRRELAREAAPGAVIAAPAPEQLPCADQPAQVLPLRWQTGSWAGKPALFAIRQVITGGATFSQGFLVDKVALLHFPQEMPTSLLPGEGRRDTEARLPILGAAWHVAVDPGPRLTRAHERARTLRRQFHQSFFAGSFGAALAGVFLVVLIRRSERLAAERSRFAAAAAHELRTPLAGIRLHGEMLGLSLGNPAKINEYAARITDEAERLSRLVANVFNYTQVDQKRLRLARQPQDLGEVVKGALALVEPIIDRAGARLAVSVVAPLPRALLDADAVHQMVRNLVDNAEKYARGAIDRHIEVSVQPEPDPEGSNRPGVSVRVRDHGPGVHEADRDLIFQPFARSSNKGVASGLGLGLAVVRTLARAHGGDVRLTTPAGGGAAFTVWFPSEATAAS
jgi:signal transduction histidine kinase